MTKRLDRMRAAAGTVMARLAGRRSTGRAASPRVMYRPQPLQRWDP